ncbi:hypothetical protein [Niveibacterium sp. SC-1]|uniref:hypothetical protein n=1 Tax=Niveibacterium sp. SC-1 TaxID=3135646 RepID=UPI00311D5704
MTTAHSNGGEFSEPEGLRVLAPRICLGCLTRLLGKDTILAGVARLAREARTRNALRRGE